MVYMYIVVFLKKLVYNSSCCVYCHIVNVVIWWQTNGFVFSLLLVNENVFFASLNLLLSIPMNIVTLNSLYRWSRVKTSCGINGIHLVILLVSYQALTVDGYGYRLVRCTPPTRSLRKQIWLYMCMCTVYMYICIRYYICIFNVFILITYLFKICIY